MKDLKFVRETLLELDPTLRGHEEEEAYQAGLILLSSLICGSDACGLAEFTGLPLSFVTSVRERMMAAELWSDAVACPDAWCTKDGGFMVTLFWTDVLVAQGLVVRRWSNEEGAYRYFASEFDPELANKSSNV